MQTNNRKVAVLIILFSIILLIAIIYFFFFRNRSVEEEIVESENTEQEIPTRIINQDTKEEPQETEIPERKVVQNNSRDIRARTKNKFDLERIASSFAERFGSFSNHSSLDNLLDLEILMSKTMQAQIEKQVTEHQLNTDYKDEYSGISTRAISSQALEFDDQKGRAKVSVKTQREKSGVENSVYYQDILINFIRENGEWKVYSAIWQEN